MTSILIAEDQAAVREAFAAMLNMQENMHVVAVASTGREAVNLAWLHQPQVALIDVQMPDGSGFCVIEQLRSTVPNCRCVMLATYDRPGYVSRAYEQGAWAFLTKTLPFTDIIHAIREVDAGKRLIGPKLVNAAQQSPLSARETEILQAAARAGSTADIANELHLTQGTINNYVSSILAKLGAGNRIQAVMIAQKNGWL